MAPFLGNPTGSSDNSGPSSRNRTPPNEVTTGYNGSEPIAIVGMACRFPGQSDTPADFWEMLVQQRSGYSEPPSSRFNINGFHSEKSNTGSLGPRGGYFISEDVYNFDPPFFGITQTEATVMDPQQRKLLECVYEAFEAGGIPLDSVSGKNIGAYVGNFTIDYGMMALRDMEYPKPYSMTGHGNTILSNRVSYVFNLCGPSFTIDTACSSSMYATHMACRALASGEVNGAIVGGTNLILDAAVQMAVDKMGVLSHTSTCHTFDASADGYGRAEGIGALYLKRLSDAIRDGDPIRGVIRGTAANANGKTSGITQPSAVGQEAVIRTAYAFAGDLNPDETSYFECHGTGTPVGDPIELRGITNMFLKDSKRDSLLIGAVKTNVGHAEAASAMASIMKVVLAMELGTIPASIGVKNYNPKIDFSNGRLQVVKDTLEWPTGYGVRRASVNSFGYGGANAHAIIESSESYLPGYRSFKKRGTASNSITQAAPQAPTGGRNSRALNVHERTQFLLPFSAQDFPSLKANVERHREVASQYELLDLAFTLGTRRSFFFNRGYAIASADTVAENLDPDEMTFGKRGSGARIAFIFTGQGAQTAQMGKELMESIPSYLKSIRDMDNTLQSLGEDAPTWTIEEALLEPKATSSIDQVHLSQPICTAVQVALVKLLREWGVTPLACVGHSSGEIAAAYAAGTITDTQAILAAYFRGVAVDQLTQRGTMLAVGLGPEEAQPYLEEGIRIACYNSPQSVTLSGDEDAAANVKAKLEADGVFVRALKTSGRAYHSHHMKDVGAIYEERANHGFAFHDALEFPKQDKYAELPLFVSSVTGELKLNFQPGPGYWRENLESPVRFTQALTRVTEIEGLGINHIVEIGPHSALAGPVRQLRDKLGMSSRDLEYTATLSRGENSVTRLLDLAGALFIKGYPIDLARVNSIEDQDRQGTITLRKGVPLVDLPRYSWNYSAGPLRAKHRINMDFQNRKFSRHDLLGSLLPGVIRDQAQWRNMLDIHDLPWLEQHRLGPQPVLPATGYIGIAVEAARQFFHDKVQFEGPFKYFIPRLSIKSALTLPPSGTAIEVMTSVRFQTVSNAVSSTNWLEFTIQSVLEGIWTDHCVGVIGRQAIDEIVPLFDETRPSEPRTSHTWYRGFANIGLNYGPPFNGLSNIRTDPWTNECVTDTKLLPTDVPTDDSRYIVHPGAMDTCLQAILIGAHNGSLKGANRSFIPVDWEEVSIYSYEGTDMPAPADVNGQILATGEFTSLRALWGSFQLSGPDGRPLFTAKKVNSITYAEDLNKNVTDDRHPYLRVVWKPDVETLETGVLPTAATDIGRPLSLTEKSVLATWARNLATAAQVSNDNDPSVARLIEVISALNFPTDAYDVDHAASDLGTSKLGDSFYRLEAIYAAMMVTLSGEQATASSVATPPEDSLTQTLDLIGHKYPGMNILQIVNSEADLARKLPAVLQGDSSLKRYSSFTYLAASDALVEAAAEVYPDGRDVTAEKVTLFEDGEYRALEGVTYNLIILPDIESFGLPAADVLKAVQPLLNETGRILVHGGNQTGAAFNEHFWAVLDLFSRELGTGAGSANTSMPSWKSALDAWELQARVVDQAASGWTLLSEPTLNPQPTKDIVVISRANSVGVSDFSGELAKGGYKVHSASLSDESFAPHPDALYVSIVELGSSLFNGNLTATEFANLQCLADSTQAIFWLTSGDLLGKVDPNAAIVQGLGRTLQTEYIQLTFVAIDLDHSDAQKAAQQTRRVLDRFSKESEIVDKEYIVKDDVFHISRLSQDAVLDKEYGEIIGKEAADEEYDATTPIRLDIDKIGLLDTLHFKADERERILESDEAEVEVKAVGLNMKEYATFRGSFHSESLSHEGAGIVHRVGSGVTDIKVGDKVCWMGKGLFGNIEHFKAIHLHQMRDDDGLSFEEMAGMPLVFATAVYGLLYLGRLKKGEKVLIHSATGGVGLAAVQIAKMVGAEIFATVGTPAKREFLKREYGLEDSHIFNSRDTSFAAGIMAATNGRGVDVALNSLVRELLAASWSVMANNGRHIEIGRTDIMEFGILDLNVFKRNTTFSAFDFGVVADDHPEIVASVMKDVMKYLREGKIRPLQPMALFPATQVSAAFAEFANPQRIGKVVVSFAPESSTSSSSIAVRREHKDAVKFKPDGTYVLIGCLGGLGRCLARFMVDRGARNLTFLGRGGADKKEAAAMVDSLRARGCAVHVVRGDVSNKEDVARAVAAAGVPVYGMVQGAMALEDKLFSKLDLPGWQYPIDPKVRGTWNLHECLAGQPLDFFVMLSSISAMTGAPTQSNYCAGNTFLDFFARYRDGLGLPATTVGLSMVLEVGFVSQNLAIEQGISRSGIHGIPERDFLLLMEQAMKPGRVGDWRLDPGAKNFLVSGLEPSRLAADLDVHGFRFWLEPRVGPLLTAIKRKSEGSGRSGAGGAKAVLDLDDIVEATVDKFAKTFMIPSDDVDPSKPLVAYGMDSMIGTALRNWGFSTFGVDVPVSDFMGPVLTAQSLAEKIFAGRS
ncbi:Uu.00g143170.m01.CDS01 [Anthostomella pinea]|uniref:Uu.00g143170.m01.CDS01 n=1 Tax=Anthostomella pinea TaxID=933095 RepID=A0AAI8VQQ5_9PEZI|nr:Uu.00g143170.m01.CDS01 [Anthostomella pinea]